MAGGATWPQSVKGPKTSWPRQAAWCDDFRPCPAIALLTRPAGRRLRCASRQTLGGGGAAENHQRRLVARRAPIVLEALGDGPRQPPGRADSPTLNPSQRSGSPIGRCCPGHRGEEHDDNPAHLDRHRPGSPAPPLRSVIGQPHARAWAGGVAAIEGTASPAARTLGARARQRARGPAGRSGFASTPDAARPAPPQPGVGEGMPRSAAPPRPPTSYRQLCRW
jgi:hypothetical protein